MEDSLFKLLTIGIAALSVCSDKYELPPGKHTLELTVTNPHEKVYLDLDKFFTFTKTAE